MKHTNKPLVTAVITTYNRPTEIVERAVKSVIFQDYENIELIVINDYPDNTELSETLRLMLEKYQDRLVKYIVVEKNGGACKARNIGLSNSLGEYIAFLDDDDEWLPNKISLQINKMQEDVSNAIVYCNSYINFEDLNVSKLRFKNVQAEGNIFCKLIENNIIGSCSFPMFRTDVLRASKGFREDMPALQDWELYLRITQKHNAGYVHEPLATYYFYDGDRISTHPERRTIAFEKISQEFQNYLKTNKKSAAAFFRKGIYFYGLNKELGKSLKCFIHAVISDPLSMIKSIGELLKSLARVLIKPRAI